MATPGLTSKLTRLFNYVWPHLVKPDVNTLHRAGAELAAATQQLSNNVNFAISERHGVGTLANRPVPAANGRFYYESDVGYLDEDINGVWTTVGGIIQRNAAWTPTLLATTTNPTVSYAVQVGRYMALPYWVMLYYYVAWNSQAGGAGQAYIGGNPNFACVNYSQGYIGNAGLAVAGGPIGIQMPPGTNQLGVIAIQGGAAYPVTNFPAGFAQMLGFMIYATA